MHSGESKVEDAPRAKNFNVGYGKASVDSNKLLITNTSVVVPNSYEFLNADDKKVRAGYFSHSALQTYRRCQKLYYHKYVLKVRKPRPSVKMWGGSAIHDTVEKLANSKINNPQLAESIRAEALKSQRLAGKDRRISDVFTWGNVTGLSMTEQAAIDNMRNSYGDFTTSYESEVALHKLEGGASPPAMSWGARITSENEFLVMYDNAVRSYMNTEFILSKPKSTEDLIIYHLPLHKGGTVPIVGFIDAIEETAFMDEYRKVSTSGDSAEQKVLAKIDDGEDMIVDHKCGSVLKTYEHARIDQQLTLYSLATGIKLVGFDNIKLGTTGGKNPKKAKPATVFKTFARRTEADYEKLTNDFNTIITGITEGIFDKSGSCNSMVCSPTLCEYYGSKECFG